MKMLIHQAGTDNNLEIPEDSWPSYQQAGWMYVGPVPVDPIKTSPAKKKEHANTHQRS